MHYLLKLVCIVNPSGYLFMPLLMTKLFTLSLSEQLRFPVYLVQYKAGGMRCWRLWSL